MEGADNLQLLSHHPRHLEGDRLGFADYAQTIYEILANLSYDRTGLTIGIYGDWGSGKSTILTMAGETLDEQSEQYTLRVRAAGWLQSARDRFRTFGRRFSRQQSEPAPDQILTPERYHPLVVRFEAWKYSNEQVWIALLRTIVQTSLDEARRLGYGPKEVAAIVRQELGQWLLDNGHSYEEE